MLRPHYSGAGQPILSCLGTAGTTVANWLPQHPAAARQLQEVPQEKGTFVPRSAEGDTHTLGIGGFKVGPLNCCLLIILLRYRKLFNHQSCPSLPVRAQSYPTSQCWHSWNATIREQTCPFLCNCPSHCGMQDVIITKESCTTPFSFLQQQPSRGTLLKAGTSNEITAQVNIYKNHWNEIFPEEAVVSNTSMHAWSQNFPSRHQIVSKDITEQPTKTFFI